MNTLDVNQSARASLLRRGQLPTPAARPMVPAASHAVLASGRFKVDHIRNGKRINSYSFPNGITNEGKDHLLDVVFHGDTQITAWFLGLIDDASFSALAAADVYAQINGTNGWDEFTDYTDPANADSALTRPAWTEGAASGQSITNGTVVEFDITGSGTVKGVFVVGGGTDPEDKDDAAGGGTLWATALFSGGDVPVLNGDTLRVTYTVSA